MKLRHLAPILILAIACDQPIVTKDVNAAVPSIKLPPAWQEVAPKQDFTLKKAVAPDGQAAISLAARDSLWRSDTDSVQYSDAWSALDHLTEATFRERFERNDPSGNEYPTIHAVEKRKLGSENAIYVDYDLTNRVRGSGARIQVYFILHHNRWYSVIMATSSSQPSLHRPEMEAAAQTFHFVGAV